jgi:hypothetical protein
MKILIGNNHLDTMGGSETYTYTLASELIKMGHTVEIMLGNSRRLGTMSNKIKDELGVNVEVLTGNYDGVFLNHNTTLNRFFHLGLTHNCDVFQICHGTIPPEEQPYLGNEIKYITISEEVSNHLKENFGKESVILRNLIDMSLYNFTEINEKPKSVYSLAQSDTMNHVIKVICEEMGIEFSCNNKLTNSTSSVVEKISPSDIVISLGRGCYEAMAMGKNVLVIDMRPYMPGYMDGLINSENFTNFIECNCSGRYSKIKVDVNLIKSEILKYTKSQGSENRDLIDKYFNSTKIVSKMLDLINVK